MNRSIFQLAPWAGPAYLALADAIELAIRAGSVQAGDRLPPQRMLADFLGLHVNTVNRALRETRQRGSRAATGVMELWYLPRLYKRLCHVK
jgi:GntR family transcriptional regulator